MAASPNFDSHWLYFQHYWLQGPNLSPLLTPYNSKQRGTPNRLLSGVPGLHADRARCLPQGQRCRGRIPKLCLPLATCIFSPLLTTGTHFDPLSGPLKPKATAVHLVGPIQASQAYTLIGPVASHKVKDSEAASPNFLTHILHLWVYKFQLRDPFWPLTAQAKRGTPSRPQTGLPCLHTHGVRCLPQGRKFRGSIPKLCFPQAILSPFFGHRAQRGAPFWSLTTQSNGGTPNKPHTGLPSLHAVRARCLPQCRRFRGTSPNFASYWLYFHHYWLQDPTLTPFLTPLNPKQREYT